MPTPSAELHFIGTATLLIRFGDVTLLTDPNFLHRGQRAYLGHGLASRRLSEPALDVRELPQDLDAVVLSHLHGDHWDRVTRRYLDRSLPIVTTPHAARRLQGVHGFRRAVGLQTWEGQLLIGTRQQVRVTSLPGAHARGAAARLLPPVMGSLLEFGDLGGPVQLRIYLTGDTLMFPGIEEIARRCPDLDLAVLHLGGTTLPGGLLVTMDGRQGADMLEMVRPRQALPVHYDDYSVFRSPLDAFLRQVEERGWEGSLVHCPRGEKVSVSAGGKLSV